jgi:hypothetical protein
LGAATLTGTSAAGANSVSERWFDPGRVAIAPTLDADELQARGHEKIACDEGEGPTPKATRANAKLGEQVSPITLAVRRHRAKKAVAESVNSPT